jgi:hypothetical protein
LFSKQLDAHTGSGQGTVQVEFLESGAILYHEHGIWTSREGRQSPFRNVFRWTADPAGHFLRLEHLRQGPEQPVYLFDLVPVAECALESGEPHVCREDLYTARLEFDAEGVRLCWTIVGPRKDEQILYLYR